MAYSVFLNIPGREKASEGEKKWIPIKTLQFTLTVEERSEEEEQRSAAGIVRAAYTAMTAVTISRTADEHSPRLMSACGKVLREAQIQVVVSSGEVVRYVLLEFRLEGVVIGKFKSALAPDERPTETIEMQFNKITQIFTPEKDSGSHGKRKTGVAERGRHEKPGSQ